MKHVISDDVELTLPDQRFAEELFALVDTNRERLRAWLPWVDGTKSVEDTRGFITNARKRFAERGDIAAMVWFKGKIAGCVDLCDINSHSGTAEIGYWIGGDYEGKGLVTVACRALLDHAFSDLGLQRVQIRVEPANERSKAIPKRLGFQHEGTLRSAVRPRDCNVDLEIYSILRDELAG